MGAGASCPQGFEQGLVFTCRATCPARFKYLQEQDPPGEFCVSMYDNTARVQLMPLRAPPPPPPEPDPSEPQSPEAVAERARAQAEYATLRAQVDTAYAAERNRVDTEIASLTQQVASKQPVQDALLDARAQMGANVSAYTKIRTELAQYETFDNPTSVKDLVDELKPLRPPTAPASDLAIERKAILESSAPNFLLIQVQLAIVILCLLAYSFLPMDVAPGVAVLLLSVGVAVGIFLWKR